MIKNKYIAISAFAGVLLLLSLLNLYQAFQRRDDAIRAREQTVTAFRPFTDARRALYELELFLLDSEFDSDEYEIKRAMFKGALSHVAKPDNRPYFTDETMAYYENVTELWDGLQPDLDEFATNPSADLLNEIQIQFEAIRLQLTRGSDGNILERATVRDLVEQREDQLTVAVAIAIVLMLIFTASVSTSIVHLRNTSQAVVAALARAEDVSRAKSRFLGNFANQMHQPLDEAASLTLLLSQGAFGEVTDEQKNSLFRLLASIEYLRNLLSDILVIAALDDNLISPAVGTINLDDLLQKMKHASKTTLEKTNAQLIIQPMPTHPELVSDEDKLLILLSRLVSHVARHSQTINLSLAYDSAHIIFKIENGQDQAESSLEFTIAHRLADFLGGSLQSHANELILKLPVNPDKQYVVRHG